MFSYAGFMKWYVILFFASSAMGLRGQERGNQMEWSQFRGNDNRTGAVGQTEITKPRIAWRYPTGDIIESSPCMVDGRVFVGGHAKRLHAIDAKTGELQWKFDVGGWVRGSPSVVNGVVYFGSDDDKFYALDAGTGEKRWEFGLQPGGQQSSAAVRDEVVYFGAFDHGVYALDANTGKDRKSVV